MDNIYKKVCYFVADRFYNIVYIFVSRFLSNIFVVCVKKMKN